MKQANRRMIRGTDWMRISGKKGCNHISFVGRFFLFLFHPLCASTYWMVLSSNDLAIANQNQINTWNTLYLHLFLLSIFSLYFCFLFIFHLFRASLVTIDLLMFIIIYVEIVHCIWSQRLHVNLKWYLNIERK